MKTVLLSLGIGFGILFTALAVILLVELKDNRDLRAENRNLWTDLQQTHGKMQALSSEKSEASDKLSAKESEVDELQGKLAAKDEPTKDLKAETAPPRAYQVRAFLGREFLGMAWVVPSKIAKDPKTGAFTSEPVVVLNEGLKKAFTELRTNVVEREVPVNSSVSYNYYPYPYYWYYPGVFSTNSGTITNFPSKSNPRPATSVRVQTGGAPWTPVTVVPGPPAPGIANRRTGANAIGMRQQALGIAAAKNQAPILRTPLNN
jgi:hypothetical protein